jgi:hypothetical protein
MLKQVKCSSLYTGKISYGIVTSETKCYFTVTFKKTYSNGNDKIVKLFKRDGAMNNWDNEFVYYLVVEVVEINKYILLVMKWLNDSELVSQEELDVNSEYAWTNYRAYAAAAADRAAYWAAAYASYAADAADTAAAYWVASYAADTAADTASYAADTAAAAAAAAAVWVDKYFKSTNEDKQTYIDKLGE